MVFKSQNSCNNLYKKVVIKGQLSTKLLFFSLKSNCIGRTTRPLTQVLYINCFHPISIWKSKKSGLFWWIYQYNIQTFQKKLNKHLFLSLALSKVRNSFCTCFEREFPVQVATWPQNLKVGTSKWTSSCCASGSL